MKDMMIGVDLAKNVFQVHGALRAGEIQFRKKLTRKQFTAFMARQDPCLVIFAACGRAHYWAREMASLGHVVKLIAPQYARPFVKRQKNDAADAEALVIVARQPEMRFAVPTQHNLDGRRLHQVIDHAPVPGTAGIAAMKRLAHDARER